MWSRLTTFLRRGAPVPQGCSGGVVGPVKGVSTPPLPPLRRVPPRVHAQELISDLQDSGHTGVQPRGSLLIRYGETCVGADLEPISFNALCEALGAICEKRRPLVNGHRITAYVIPEKPRKRPNLAVVPNGNISDEIPFDLPERHRSGTHNASA